MLLPPMPKALRYLLYSLAALLLFLLSAIGAMLLICRSCDTTCPPGPIGPNGAARLRQHVEMLCAAPRYGDTKQQARNYIAEQFRRAGWHVELQYFTNNSGETHCNISARRPGKSEARYIIGAHYDACDTDAGNPGADDNASAVAVLLELARRLPATEMQYGLELVAWDCEEPPYFDTADMGSAHHAATCTPQQVKGLICLEMLGYYSDAPGSQPPLFPGHSLLLPTVGNFIAVIGDWHSIGLSRNAYNALRREMPTLRLNIPCAHGTELWFSDHRNYAPRGIPSIMLTDTSMLRNSHYHEPTDTPDTLNYEAMERATRGILRLVQTLSHHTPFHRFQSFIKLEALQ